MKVLNIIEKEVKKIITQQRNFANATNPLGLIALDAIVATRILSTIDINICGTSESHHGVIERAPLHQSLL
jgi:hypothetical protein